MRFEHRSSCRFAHARARGRSQGVALVITLILLFIVTLLATTGMMTSTAELVMAGNEQFHRRAADAASAGTEAAIARLAAIPVSHLTAFTAAGRTVAGDYLVSTRYVGEEANLPGFSAEKFAAVQFEVDSTGRAGRNASDEQFQGVMIVTSMTAASTFAQIGAGLAEGAPEP
jgi:Tfp pilus assembly protein PilX